jgi:hypothetical protein
MFFEFLRVVLSYHCEGSEIRMDFRNSGAVCKPLMKYTDCFVELRSIRNDIHFSNANFMKLQGSYEI